jgi:hypothetical protein
MAVITARTPPREHRDPRGTVAPGRDEVERKLRLDAVRGLDHDQRAVLEDVGKELGE